MKDLRNFCFYLTLFFTYSIANGQAFSKDYLKPAAPFHADSIVTPISMVMLGYTPKNHVWLTSLSNGYIDTNKNKINSAAIPAYVSLKKSSLLNPNSAPNQVICAMLPYGSYFPFTQYGVTQYGLSNTSYRVVPGEFNPYTIKTKGSSYYLLPKL